MAIIVDVLALLLATAAKAAAGNAPLPYFLFILADAESISCMLLRDYFIWI
jgi:hypothetical protein